LVVRSFAPLITIQHGADISVACRASRRALTCSGSRAAGDSLAWSCRPRSASVDAGIRHIEFLDWRLEITAGAPQYTKAARGIWSSNLAIRQAERQLAEQAEASYKRMVKDQQAGAPARKVGASVTAERA